MYNDITYMCLKTAVHGMTCASKLRVLQNNLGIRIFKLSYLFTRR